MVSFLRDMHVVKVMSSHFNSCGLEWLSEMLKGGKVVSFAARRWTTLHVITKRMRPFLKWLITHYPAALFKRVKDKAWLDAVTKAFPSSVWYMQFEFVADFTGWLTPLMQ